MGDNLDIKISKVFKLVANRLSEEWHFLQVLNIMNRLKVSVFIFKTSKYLNKD